MQLKRENIRFYVLTYLPYAMLSLGIALRICIYLQNRDLFIDEANIARNVYERSYAQLLFPLSYRQYAPPIFLWLLKLSTNLFGYSEYAYRAISLLAGIGSLVLLYLVLKKYQMKNVIWYPLFLMATGPIYLRYATELKQYGFDSFIALGLVYLALEIDLRKIPPLRFFLIWILSGTLAIWSSMPSVFILAGVGVYFLASFYQARDYKKIYALIAVGLLWIFQFILYYQLILKQEVYDDGLQNFHKDSFLFFIPHSMAEIMQNWNATINILGTAGGHWGISLGFHIAAILLALYYSVRQRVLELALLVIPLLLLLCAAALHQYALTSRLILFIMPLVLVLIGIGLELILRYRYIWALVVPVSVVCMYNFSQSKYLYEPLRIQQITDCLGFLKAEEITGGQLYVDEESFPMYSYYTTIHPDRGQWTAIKNGAELQQYATNFDSLAMTMKGKTALLYGYKVDRDINIQQAQINSHVRTVKHYSGLLGQVYIYTAP